MFHFKSHVASLYGMIYKIDNHQMVPTPRTSWITSKALIPPPGMGVFPTLKFHIRDAKLTKFDAPENCYGYCRILEPQHSFWIYIRQLKEFSYIEPFNFYLHLLDLSLVFSFSYFYCVWTNWDGKFKWFPLVRW